jgi:hypothetical protein
MKAMSAVLLQIQRPMTIMGISPALAGLSVTAGSVGGALCVMLDLTFLFLPVFVVITAGLWTRFWRACRKDHHYDRLLLLAPRFWRGRPARTLIAGRP